MSSVSIFLRSIKDRPALLAFLWVAALIVLLCLAFDPRWESNDDVAMSKVAHGWACRVWIIPPDFFQCALGLLGARYTRHQWCTRLFARYDGRFVGVRLNGQQHGVITYQTIG